MCRRISLATMIGFLALMFAVMPASAGLVWCQGDPIVNLNGTKVQIIMAIPVDDQPRVTGPIHVEIGTPGSVDRRLISTDSGFNNHGEKVTFRDINGGQAGSVFPVEVSVSVPIDAARSGSDIPAKLTIIVKDADPLLVYGTAARTRAHINVPSTS